MPIEINGTGSITGVDSLSTPAVTNAAGSASAPSITFTGDTNTGLYSPGADQVAVTTGGTGRLFIDASGRLLVGTSSAEGYYSAYTPSTLFTPSVQVKGAYPSANLALNTTNDGSVIHLVNSSTSTASGRLLGAISFNAADGTNNLVGAGILAYTDATTGTNDMPGRLVFSTTADGASSPTEAVRIDSQQRVGINASIYSAPLQAPLTVGTAQSTSAPAIFITSGSYATNNRQVISYGFNFAGAQIPVCTLESIILGVGPTRGGFILKTCDNDVAIEAFRVNSSQELLVGYTADNGNYKLQVNSQIFATSSTIATSDGRYKENVSTLGGCVDLIKALRPVSFTWKPQQDITRTDEEGNEVLVREGHNFPVGTQVGFIAQEVQEVLADKPWLSSVIKENVRPAVTDADGNELAPEEEFLGIAEGNLIAVLTSALQEAIGEIESLKARLTAAGI